MSDEVKHVWDVVLTIVTMSGAAIAFCFGLVQWRRGQAWQRAEKLDRFIEKFESDELLKLGAAILDWTDRRISLRGGDLTVKNKEALLALRDHRTIKKQSADTDTAVDDDGPMFPGEQAKLRDAYDALLSFFERLELSISTELIDSDPARAYFSYWLERLVTFDRHRDDDGSILAGKTPAEMVAIYIKTYSDPHCIKRLCERFGIKIEF